MRAKNAMPQYCRLPSRNTSTATEATDNVAEHCQVTIAITEKGFSLPTALQHRRKLTSLALLAKTKEMIQEARELRRYPT